MATSANKVIVVMTPPSAPSSFTSTSGSRYRMVHQISWSERVSSSFAFLCPMFFSILNLHNVNTNGRRLNHATDSGRQPCQQLLCGQNGVRKARSIDLVRPARMQSSLTADHLERDIHVAARRMRVGTDFLVCFPHEHGEIGLSNALILDAHLHREPKTTTLADADRCRACYLGRRRVFILLLGDEIERAAEAGRVACGEQVLRGRPGLGWPAHCFRYRKVSLNQTVI